MHCTRSLKPTAMGAALALALTLTTSALAAQQQVDDRRPANSDVSIEIQELIVGEIVVTGWDQNEVWVTGTIGRDVDEFYVEGGPGSIEIGADFNNWDDDHDNEDGRRRWRGRRDRDDVAINLEIRVPRGASLEIEAVTAAITVKGVDGAIDIESVTGAISYEGNATSLDLANVTGSISAKAPALREADFESVNGSIRFEGGFAPDASIDFENVNGSVELFLSADVSARFDIETMMGSITNEFGPEAKNTSRWVPSKELSFSTGSGRGEVSIETLQGSIRLIRR